MSNHFTPFKARIAGRRIRMACGAVPNWLQDVVTAFAIALPLWALVVATLLVW